MDRCKQIVANVRMEECYQELSLVFNGTDQALCNEIDAVIKDTCRAMRMDPSVFHTLDIDGKGSSAFCIEFDDQAQRDAGNFFLKVLQRLGIDHCEYDVVPRIQKAIQ